MRTKIAVLLIVIPLVSVFAQTENVQPQPTEIQTPAQTERPQTAAEETRAVARSRREAPREDALVLFRQGNYTRAAEVCRQLGPERSAWILTWFCVGVFCRPTVSAM